MSSLIVYSLILSASAMLFASVVTWALIEVLPRFSFLDQPEERKNHTAPIPRGGGLAVVSAALFFLLVSGISTELAVAILIIAAISFADDYRSQPILRRVMVHVVASLLAVSTIPLPVFQGLLPFYLDHALAAFLLIYFLNIYNFMDGIDEISAVQTFSIGFGLMAMVLAVPGLARFIGVDGMVMAGAMGGFWLFNRHPARIFLGDVGSIPIGLFMGTLLLVLSSQGQWAAALILPAYYLTDGSLTLLRRVLRGVPFWHAHSEHAYQLAVRNGLSHRQVVSHLVTLHFVLIVLAVVSSLDIRWALGCIALAYGLALMWQAQLRGVVMRGVLLPSVRAHD